MSLRALKKRENQQLQTNTNHFTANKHTLYKKSFGQQQIRKYLPNNEARKQQITNLSKQKQLLGRNSYSNPELYRLENRLQAYDFQHQIRTKSENDIRSLVVNKPMSAKSEVCLQSISTHDYQNSAIIENKQLTSTTVTMLSGARSHRDLLQSSPLTARGMRSQSLTSAISTSTIDTNASISTEMSANAVLRVPIIGYEVMEERARFTVYKLRVENPLTHDCWLVLRRYTDFVRLNTKLKQHFPHFTLLLPRKKIFGDNFNAVFLDNRVQGLQMFVNSIMNKAEIRASKLVRDFFCLDEPPTYSESMEECRAIFEAQEETIAHLKLQINSKNDLILSLQQKLREESMEKNQLKESLK